MKRELTVQKSNIIAIFGFLFVYFLLTFTVYLIDTSAMSARQIIDTRLYYMMVTWVVMFGLPLIPWLFVATDNKAFYLQQGVSRYKIVGQKFVISFLVFILSGVALYFIFDNLMIMIDDVGLFGVRSLTSSVQDYSWKDDVLIYIVLELIAFKLSFSFFMGLDLLRRYSLLIKLSTGIMVLLLYVAIISSFQFYFSDNIELLDILLTWVFVVIVGSLVFDIFYIRRGEV